MASKRILLALVLIVAATAGLLGGTMLTDLPGLSPAHARQAAPPEAPKWEYCGLAFVVSYRQPDGKTRGVATVKYFGSKRIGQIEGVDTDEALANAFTQLGSEGWELVGPAPLSVGGTTDNGTVYFKRLKR